MYKMTSRSIENYKWMSSAMIAAMFSFYLSGWNSLLWSVWIFSGLVGIVLFIYQIVKHSFKKKDLFIFFLLCAWMIIPVFNAPNVYDNEAQATMIIITTAFSLFSVYYTARLVRQEVWVNIIGIASLIWLLGQLIFASFFLVSGGNYFGFFGRFASSYENPNTVAVTGAFIAAFWAFYGYNVLRSRFFWILVLLAIIFVMALSGSIKGLLSLVVIWGCFLLLRRSGTVWAISFAILVVFLSVGSYLFSTTLERAMSRFDDFEFVSISDWRNTKDRQFLIGEGIYLITERPFLGYGIHNSQWYLYTPRYFALIRRGEMVSQVGIYSHNNYVEMGLNAGLPGIILYYGPLFFLLIQLWRMKGGYEITSSEHNACCFFITIIAVKLFQDIAVVSYANFIHIFFVALGFTFLYNKKRNMPNHRLISAIPGLLKDP